MIPAEAVEAAAKAMFDTRDDPYDMDEWEDIDSTEREPYICQARAALEAAAPYMLAGAWDEGGEAAIEREHTYGREEKAKFSNPYRTAP